MDIEHPDITTARRTGYPHRYAEDEEVFVCEVCENEIDYDDVYEDGGEILCRHCLLDRYKKRC